MASAYLVDACRRMKCRGLDAATLPSSSGRHWDNNLADSQIALRRWRVVQRVARWLPGATCLVCALALQRFLYRAGVVTQLCIGAKRDGRQFRAHAWLELNGRCVGDNGLTDKRFKKLTSLSTPPTAKPSA